ncbi:transcription initiation factor TFIID subunit 11-like [Papaver somniferum]|uniref:transcription initiation factor TFIID subunit 11-like n=1 Tax=Papaver somniferum TaxID=3469 RepID=UPI000E702D0B|nr:transcription initiation factor TFIID subunit 11-like [Papaver somniferum]
MSTSSSSNYDYCYSSSSSSSSDEDSKASVAKSKAKTTHDKGAKPSIPLNDRRVTYAELMKRKAEDDEAENCQRRKDRIRRRIQAVEERRRFLDGVPSDSDADASEEETAWVFTERKIKPDRYEREFQKTMKKIEAEAEAEEDSYSDDPDTHPDFIDGSDADSDKKEDNDEKSDNSDGKKDSGDESDNSDGEKDRLLPIIEEMNHMRLRDVKNQELHRWDEMISNCETLQFNVGWLRHRLEIIKIHKAAEAADAISLTTALPEEEKMLALESARVEKAVQELKTKTKSFQKKLDRVAYRDYSLLDGLL